MSKQSISSKRLTENKKNKNSHNFIVSRIKEQHKTWIKTQGKENTICGCEIY